MAYQIFPSLITIFLLDLLQKDFAWKLTVLALFVTDIKTFPLVWHVSLLPLTPSFTPFLRLLPFIDSFAQRPTICATLPAR